MKKIVRSPYAAYFTDIVIVDKDYLLFTANYYSLDDSDEEKTLVVSIKKNLWGGTNILGIAHAININFNKSNEREIWILERNRGLYKLNSISEKKDKFLTINEDRAGFLMDLQKIDNVWYAVGTNYQVYKEKNSKWLPIDKDIHIEGIDGSTKILNSIHGTSETNLYAAGMNGIIFHYDGTHWSLLDTPTNIGFQKVFCLNENTVYVCGYGHTLMKGNKNGWKIITSFDEKMIFWDIIKYQEDLYICTSNKLYKIADNDELIEIKIKIEGEVRFYRMDSNDDILCTVGNECILKFDGVNWEKINYPYNQ